MKRVPPSVRMKEEIKGLLGATEATTPTEEAPMVGFVGRLARYMLQVAIEAEATAFLIHAKRAIQEICRMRRCLCRCSPRTATSTRLGRA